MECLSLAAVKGNVYASNQRSGFWTRIAQLHQSVNHLTSAFHRLLKVVFIEISVSD
jgi:hypothetical protein